MVARGEIAESGYDLALTSEISQNMDVKTTAFYHGITL